MHRVIPWSFYMFLSIFFFAQNILFVMPMLTVRTVEGDHVDAVTSWMWPYKNHSACISQNIFHFHTIIAWKINKITSSKIVINSWCHMKGCRTSLAYSSYCHTQISCCLKVIVKILDSILIRYQTLLLINLQVNWSLK